MLNKDGLMDMATFKKKNKENHSLMRGMHPTVVRQNTYHIDAFTRCVVTDGNGNQMEMPCIQLINMILNNGAYLDNPEVLGDMVIKLHD